MATDEEIKQFRTKVLDLKISDLMNENVICELMDLQKSITDIIEMIKPHKRPMNWPKQKQS